MSSKLRMSIVVTLILIIQASVNSQSMTSIDEESRKDSAQQKRSGSIYVPIIYYTPETKMAFGSAVGYYFREGINSSESRPSTVLPLVIYTQNKQIITQLEADIYLKNETYHLVGDLSFTKFPDKFYGIGNNTFEEDEENFTPQTTSLYLLAQKQVDRGIYAGIDFQFGHTKFSKIEADGILAEGNISGIEGGKISGLGISADFDTRDNIFYPSAGWFYQIKMRYYDSRIGSDYNFNRYNFDFRNYFSFAKTHIVAVQGYLNLISGQPSFQSLSLLGGDRVMRGYYTGKYRDMNMLAFQAEYRSPMWWHLGLVGFAGFGDVAKEFGEFQLTEFKHSVGWGIRYLFSSQEKINIRIDFGYGKNSSGFYIGIGEAF